jgi:hypothetical protein
MARRRSKHDEALHALSALASERRLELVLRIPLETPASGIGVNARWAEHLLPASVLPIMVWMANHLHKLVFLSMLISLPVRAERLPVPPIPPTGHAPTRVVPHRGPTKAILSRKAPIPPNPPPSARLASPAPVPDRDVQPPPDPNSSPHTKMSVADFRPPKTDTSAALPYGSRYQSPDDQRPIETPGFTVTIPLRLP